MSWREMKIRGIDVFVLSSLVAVFLLPAAAQAGSGVLLGWSRTDWDYEIPNLQQGDIFDAKNGFQVGFFFSKSLTPVLDVRGEALYARKGAKQTLTFVNQSGAPQGEFDLFYNADYFQVPVILTCALMNEGGMRPVLMAGPYVGVKLSAQTKGDLPPLVLEKSFNGDLQDFHDTDFGIVLGAGLEFSQGDRTFLLQVRYDLGLTDAELTAQNKAWTLMTGIGF